MNALTKLIRDLLAEKLEAIDAGNSNVDEESAIAILKAVKESTDMTKRVSKLPQGEHTIGFKEKSWSLHDLNKFKEQYWNK